MTLKIINQDILKIESGILGHQVNMQGKMGKGLALSIAKKWPKAKVEYLCLLPNRRLGDITLSEVAANLYICHLHSQDRYGTNKQQTEYPHLSKALHALHHSALNLNLPVYLPWGLSCGYGGGDWEKVSDIIQSDCPSALICKI